MAEQDLGTPKLEVRHVPDSSMEQGPDGNRQRVDLPGKYQVGVVVKGAFVPLTEIGAARLHKHIDQAEQSSKSGKSKQSDEPKPS
jgi:hypothetical protein